MEIKNILIRQFTLNDYVTLYNHNREILDSPLSLEDFVPYTNDPDLIGEKFDEEDDIVWTDNLDEIDIEYISCFDSCKVYNIFYENGVEHILYTGWPGDAFTYCLTNNKCKEIEECEEKLVEQLKEAEWKTSFSHYKHMNEIYYFFEAIDLIFDGRLVDNDIQMIRCSYCLTLQEFDDTMFKCTCCKEYYCNTDTCKASSLYCSNCYWKKEY